VKKLILLEYYDGSELIAAYLASIEISLEE